jgi:hypothetical protein
MYWRIQGDKVKPLAPGIRRETSVGVRVGVIAREIGKFRE